MNYARVANMSIPEIRAALDEDGYADLSRSKKVYDIKEAAKSGSLLWTSYRITTTDKSRIDERPDTLPAD